MRILYVNKISPFSMAGAELRLWEIARRLASRGHEVHILCGRNLPELPSRQNVEEVRISNVKVLPTWLFRYQKLSFFLARYIFYLVSVPNLFRSIREADVVIDCVTPVASGAGITGKLFGKARVATVYELYGNTWFGKHGFLTAALGHLGDVFFFAQTYDGYITLSRHTVDKLKEHGKPPERVYHQFHGIGVQRPERIEPTKKVSPPEAVCISRLSKQKNVASLLRAWKIVVDAGMRGAKLRIVGDGPERENLERLAETLSISASVVLEGHVSEKRKWELLDRASAFAFPSLNEGFPIVVVEAMVAGLPVVAYDLPAFRGFLNDGEHGFVLPSNDHRRMGERLLELLQDELLRREMGCRNAEFARAFTWDRATDQEEKTLFDVLRRRSGKRATRGYAPSETM